MKSNELNAHKVIARRDTCGHSKVVPTSILDHGVYSPLSIREAVMCHLEPLKSCSTGRRGIVNLREIVYDWAYLVSAPAFFNHRFQPELAFVALCDRMVGIVGRLRTADYMSPPRTNFGAGWDGDHGAILVTKIFITGKRSIVDVLDGIIGVGG